MPDIPGRVFCFSNRMVPRRIEHATLSLSWSEKRQTIPPTLWPPNSPDLNPVNYSIWSVLQEKVYRSRIANVDELKTRLIDEWERFDQSIVDAAIGQWRCRLSACCHVSRAHFEHQF